MNAPTEIKTAKSGYSIILNEPVENKRNKAQCEMIRFFLKQEDSTYRILNNQYHVITYKTSRDAKRGTCSMVWFRGNSKKEVGRYYYRSEERREANLKQLRTASFQAKIRVEQEEVEKENRRTILKMQAAAVEVGDIFSASWGYEQTNVDFYQVIEKPSDQFAVIREISHNTVPGSEGHDCCYVTPGKDSFLADSEPRRVKLSGAGFKASRCSYATITTEDQKHYKSWYY